MTPEKQRIAIAEACGYSTFHTAASGTLIGFADGEQDKVPDYLTDLNAMHEAILAEAERNPLFKLGYLLELQKIVCPGSFPGMDVFPMVEATAAQRAEAFLRTIGQWEESTKETTK